MSEADATLEKLRALVSARQTGQPGRFNRSDDSALRMTLWDLHNQVPQNLEIFEIWQALNSAKRDPERFDKGVARLVYFLRSYRSSKYAHPSRSGVVHNGEGAHSLQWEEPRFGVIGMPSFGPPEPTRSQPPIPQPMPLGSNYAEVQNMDDMPHSSAVNYIHYTPAQIVPPDGHSSLPSGVSIEIAPSEYGDHPLYDRLNPNKPSDSTQPTTTARGNAVYDTYSSVPELMEPVNPSEPESESEFETPATAEFGPPQGQPLHAALLEPMQSGIHPSYYESPAHSRVSSSGIMTVTPVLRATTPARRPDNGGTPVPSTLHIHKSPSQHRTPGFLSSQLLDEDRLPVSDQQARYVNRAQTPPDGLLSPLSPNRRSGYRDVHNTASPISGSRPEWLGSPAHQSDVSSPSSSGYEGSSTVSPSSNEYRSVSQRSAPAGARTNFSSSLPAPPSQPSATAHPPLGPAPSRPRFNQATEPSAFHGVYAAARYSSPSHGDGVQPRPSSRGLPRSLPMLKQETITHIGDPDAANPPPEANQQADVYSSSVFEPSNPSTSPNSDSRPPYHRVTSLSQNTPTRTSLPSPPTLTSGEPPSPRPYDPTAYNKNFYPPQQDPNKSSWSSQQGQQRGLSNMSQAPPSQSGRYYLSSTDVDDQYDSSTSYNSVPSYDQEYDTSHNRVSSKGPWSSPQEPQPAAYSKPPPPKSQPGPPMPQPSTDDAGQYGSSSNYKSPSSYSQTASGSESDSSWSGFQGSQTASNAAQPPGALHATHTAPPSNSNVDHYHSSSSSNPPTKYYQSEPYNQGQIYSFQESQPSPPSVSQHPRPHVESSTPEPPTSRAGKYNLTSSSHVSSTAYSQTYDQSANRASWLSSQQPESSGSLQSSTNHYGQSRSLTGYNPPVSSTAEDSDSSMYNRSHDSVAPPSQSYKQNYSPVPPPPSQYPPMPSTTEDSTSSTYHRPHHRPTAPLSQSYQQNYSPVPRPSSQYPPMPSTAEDSTFSTYHRPHHRSTAPPSQSYQQNFSPVPAPPALPPQSNVPVYKERYSEAPQRNVSGRYPPPDHYEGGMPPGQHQSSVSQQMDAPPSHSSFDIPTNYQRQRDQYFRGGQDVQYQMDQMNTLMSMTSIGGHDPHNAGASVSERQNQSGEHGYSGSRYDSW